jgi:hypothetical protein
MSNILISLGKPATPELLDAILVALAGFAGEPTVTVTGNTTIVDFAAVPTLAPELPPVAMPTTSDIPTMTMEVPPEDVIAAITAIDIPSLTPSIEEPLTAPDTMANPAPVGLPNAVIKSLSLSTQCHAVYDPALPDTTLKVKNVSEVGDLLVFTFGGVEYKYPMADHKINVVVSFAGRETEQISCSLVVVSTEGEDELVFGANDVENISSFLSA